VTAGLQRIGRAGHNVGETSKGRIFPKFRADLLECAVVARRMREGLIETTVVPRNALDVLAQQIVAMAASADGDDEPALHIDDLHALVTRTYSYAELSRAQLENVLDMLDGRYPSEEFGDLRARIVWDRVAGTIRARKGSRALAITNAGTIPDRGLFSVNLPDGRRVGELDEEMVLRGPAGPDRSCSAPPPWRIEEITRDRVIGRPAPGVPARAVLDGRLRRAPAGARARRSARSAAGRSSRTPRRSRPTTTSTRSAARNLLDYLLEQQAATRVVPSDRTIVIERFRDEIGDWRVCILSAVRRPRPRGRGGLALSAEIRDEYGLESDAICRDDGFMSTSRTQTSRPGPSSCSSTPTRWRTRWWASWAARRCSARASGRMRVARC
jgi:ATP-dependent Lhr-like helicase